MSKQLTTTILRDLDTLVREIHALYESKFKNDNIPDDKIDNRPYSNDNYKGRVLTNFLISFLTRVYENPGISLSDLSYELKMDKTSITRAIQKLIDSEYITKIQDLDDKRIWHLFTTEKCKDLYAEIIAEKNRIISICFNDVNHDETNMFSRIVNLISNNINREWNKSINKNIKVGEAK